MKANILLLSLYALSVHGLECPNTTCLNGGQFDSHNCNCECYPSYIGDQCQYLDCNVDDGNNCLYYTINYCLVKEIEYFCPHLCKICDKNPFPIPNRKDPLHLLGRSVFVHLFEWKWTDIADECERFLGPNGFAGVQVSPPNEHAIVEEPFRPWWQRYQPVSYKLVSRSGNKKQFIDMVNRCNAVGVRIYVDTVINHMSATDGRGSAGTESYPAIRRYPGVPYDSIDFNNKNCNSSTGGIENYNDRYQVRNCDLLGLPDLNIGSEYVRQKIAKYMNGLIKIGVAGFRIDASKHMWPNDLLEVYDKLKNVREDIFGPNKRAFIFQEVIDLGKEPIKSSQYTSLGRVTEFKFGMYLSQAIFKKNGQKMANLKSLEQNWNLISDSDSVVFIDNHDNQRGHGAGGELITYKNSREYIIGNAFMLAWPYGFVKIMSSYDFPLSQDYLGPPSNSDGSTKNVTINNDESCGKGWVCEHRWNQIYNMVKFRNLAEKSSVLNWWDNGGNQIAFSRGNKAFIAINNDDYGMDVKLKTGMPGGTYCDIISGKKINGACSGKSIIINNDGTVEIYIPSYFDHPIIAIHIDSKI